MRPNLQLIVGRRCVDKIAMGKLRRGLERGFNLVDVDVGIENFVLPHVSLFTVVSDLLVHQCFVVF